MIEAGGKSSFQNVPLLPDNMLTYPPCPPPGDGARCVSPGRCGKSDPSKETGKTGETESGFAPGSADAGTVCLPLCFYVLCPSPKSLSPPAEASVPRCSRWEVQVQAAVEMHLLGSGEGRGVR